MVVRPTSDGLAARWITALLGLPVVALALWSGGAWWTALVVGLVALGVWEWHGLLLARAGSGLGAGARTLALIAGTTVIGGSLAHLVLLRALPEGWAWCLIAVGGAWATDATAFFVGRRLGGPPLAPRLSPRKTVAGALGGLGGALLWVGLTAPVWVGLRPGTALVLGLLLGCLAQAGDLLESAVKRWAGAKDSGRLLPGHGGVLDRFDSLLLVAPAVYYFQWLINR